MSFRYFVPCTLGLEEVVKSELQELGAGACRIRPGGVACKGTRRLGYAATLWLRAGIRVQELLAEGRASGKPGLHAFGLSLDWRRFMTVDQSLAVDASVKDSSLTHSLYAAQLLKDAVVDQWRKRVGRRPRVDRVRPDLPLKLVIQRDHARLYRVLSGGTLHKRGWRPIQVRSPLNEALAAGLLLLSGWDQKSPFLDPMCGSGTFLVEGAWMALDRAPGLKRHFPFERWPDFDRELWESLRLDAVRRLRSSLPFKIHGSDRHQGALALAQKGVQAAGVSHVVSLSNSPLASLEPPPGVRSVVTNPPYGRRLGEGADLEASWRELGAFLHRMEGGVAFILSGNPEVTRHLGLKSDRKWPVMNSRIACRFMRYPLHGRGKKRLG